LHHLDQAQSACLQQLVLLLVVVVLLVVNVYSV
jgi:hypothetical protein